MAHIGWSSLLWIGLSMCALLLFALYVNVPTQLTPEDERMLSRLHLSKGGKAQGYALEIKQIQDVQRIVLGAVSLGHGIPEGAAREPADLISAGQGLCFDRSRTLDKAYAFLGYKVRHVYILYRENVGFIKALLNKGQNSHAVTEVLTSKGWLLVDSNSPWISIARDQSPVPADAVWLRTSEFTSIPQYMTHPYWAIPGLYSRHGQFYPPYIQFPNVNWMDLLLG